MTPLVSVVTLFPEFFQAFCDHSVVGRALKNGLFELQLVNPRTWGLGAYRSVDDYSYGGDGGMTLRPEPLEAAYRHLCSRGKPFVLYPTPQGVPLTQDLVESLPRDGHMALFCGHYEGLDERFVQRRVDLEVSVGDYVLTGGELPAMTLIDAWARLIPGVVGNAHSVVADSFYDGMLDTCHFTRPALWDGRQVPSPLLGGNAASIEEWRRAQALERTLTRRPDLLAQASLRPYLPHSPRLVIQTVQAPNEQECAILAALGRTHDLAKIFICPPAFDRQAAVGLKSALPPEFKVEAGLAHVISAIKRKTGLEPLVVQPASGDLPWLEAKRRIAQSSAPLLFVVGGAPVPGALALRPPAGIDPENQRAALLAVTLDRFFGSRS